METVSSDRCSEHINVERVRVRKVVVPVSGPGGLMGAGESAGKRVDSGTAVPPFTRFLRVLLRLRWCSFSNVGTWWRSQEKRLYDSCTTLPNVSRAPSIHNLPPMFVQLAKLIYCGRGGYGLRTWTRRDAESLRGGGWSGRPRHME